MSDVRRWETSSIHIYSHVCFFVCSLEPSHRTEKRYISSASLMSWTQHIPSRAASGTRVFMKTLAFTWASQQKIQKVLTWVSTLEWQSTSYTEFWRTKMVDIKNKKKSSTRCLYFFHIPDSVSQVKCWCIASWEWADRPRWCWPTWWCGSGSLWGILWGISRRSEPSTPTSIFCLCSLNWMSSWHSDESSVHFSDPLH